ncbi:N-acetylmuramoyl-L-alanine amidase [Lacinutrix sp. Bg11-31]|uniref:N-acetylmuramoyl-L-alanine amidase family protein n=1 Tax=Lacinutrix sp. Bg11-31 TaxID=2057808 RepID=UPI000C307D18|nr:N-acetylmuramoyl-L-alanine amidase [Lacinutrix sp. Bg11-31]AUC81549.1 N-acetylmuramoyl-L-alanine amidase [Lacinutrix sp. Bg11-31]
MQTKLKTLFLLIIITLTVSLSVNAQTESGKFIVVLDAGHGGKDPGNLGSGFKEKKIALNIILKVGAALEKMHDFKVIYTRKTDVFIELRERAAIANRADADLFVSVHCDSHTSQAHGAGTFVMSLSKSSQNLSTAKKENEVIYLEDNYEVKYSGFNPDKPESLIGISALAEENLDNSILVANIIQEKMVKLKRKNRKVKQDVFWVLHNTYMPSVLVETGFLTYKKEGSYLNSNKGQTEMSKAIKDGIVSYKKQIDGNFVDSDYIIIKDDENETVIPAEEKIIPNTIFKVQIAAASKKVEPKSYNFKGLKEVSRDKEGKLYKYFYGYTSDINKIQKMKKVAKQKGFKSAFIVAYRDGERISLQKALNSGAK